jgi:diguanylate cyclase (GGDEF)-like protein
MTTRTQPPMDERQLVALITDGQTGLLNATYFGLRMEEEFKKSWRFQWPCALVLFEVDGLDAVESEDGVRAADALVLDIAGEILTASRDVDLSARLGRARFAAFLPGTPASGAVTMVQRVLQGVLAKVEDRVSVSVGISAAPQEKLASADEFMARAEQAMNVARGQGNNQVVTWNAKSH